MVIKYLLFLISFIKILKILKIDVRILIPAYFIRKKQNKPLVYKKFRVQKLKYQNLVTNFHSICKTTLELEFILFSTLTF